MITLYYVYRIRIVVLAIAAKQWWYIGRRSRYIVGIEVV